jgi:hypothetical protein
MQTQCPGCLGHHARPTGHTSLEWPLALLFVQPYRCARCGHRFYRFRMPDRLLRALQADRLLVR